MPKWLDVYGTPRNPTVDEGSSATLNLRLALEREEYVKLDFDKPVKIKFKLNLESASAGDIEKIVINGKTFSSTDTLEIEVDKTNFREFGKDDIPHYSLKKMVGGKAENYKIEVHARSDNKDGEKLESFSISVVSVGGIDVSDGQIVDDVTIKDKSAGTNELVSFIGSYDGDDFVFGGGQTLDDRLTLVANKAAGSKLLDDVFYTDTSGETGNGLFTFMPLGANPVYTSPAGRYPPLDPTDPTPDPVPMEREDFAGLVFTGSSLDDPLVFVG